MGISTLLSGAAGVVEWAMPSLRHDCAESFLRELAWLACAVFWISFVWVGVNLIDAPTASRGRSDEGTPAR
jgi:hypothetical protein